MSTDPDSTPHLGKRQHSGPSSPRQTTPNKRSKLDDGSVAMDVDPEVNDASLFTPTLDGSRFKDINIRTSLPPPEITETTMPTVESPRSISSSVTHTASPTARKTSSQHHLHPTMKEKIIYGTPENEAQKKTRVLLLQAKVKRWKKDSEPPKVTYETPGSLLYDAIVQEHEELFKEGKVTNQLEPFDPLKEWFHRLGLPCHPVRVKSVSSKKKKATRVDQVDTEKDSGPSVDPQTTPRAAALPLPSDLADTTLSRTSEHGESAEKEVTNAENSRRDLTASRLDCDTMRTYYHWVFSFPQLPKNGATTKPKKPMEKGAAKKPKKPKEPENIYKWTEQRTKEQELLPAPQIVERPVPPKLRKSKNRSLARLIDNHLLHEGGRMLDVKAHAPKLRIPSEWEEEAARPASPFHDIADDCKLYFPLPTKGTHRTPEPCELHSITGSESSQGDTDPLLDEGEASDPSTPTRQCTPLPGTTEPRPNESNEANISRALLQERELKEAKLQRQAEENLDKAKHRSKNTVPFSPFTRGDPKVDAEELCGDTTYNEDSLDLVEYPPTIISRFLAYGNATKLARSEGRVEKTVGGVIIGIVVGKDLTDHDNRPLPFPPHLEVVRSTPSPDAFVRASMGLGWPESLLPVVYAAEAKPICTLNEDKIGAQLAAAFHATLIILILYYLDTRKNLDSVLPPWLFLYGVEYTEVGLNITAHHPSYVFEGDAGHWELRAKLLTTDYSEVFRTGNPETRLCLLAVLLKIRSHSFFVLNKLRIWKQAPAVLDVLLKGKPAKRVATPLNLSLK